VARWAEVLISCLEESDALPPGQLPDALGVYMEMVKFRKGEPFDIFDDRIPFTFSITKTAG
jgi:hypothetical protein